MCYTPGIHYQTNLEGLSVRMTTYTARHLADLPADVIVEFDGLNDHLAAAFANYQAQLQRVYVTWGREGRPTAVSVLAGPVITGYLDAGIWRGDHYANALRRARAMMESWLSVSPYLIVHDADNEDPWIDLGFRELEPPATTQRPLRIFAYGELPNLDDLFRARRLSWEHPEWRSKDPPPPSPEARAILESLARRILGPPPDEE